MKGLFLILSLILVAAQNSEACKGFQEPEVAGLVKEAKRLSNLLSDDLKYLKVQKFDSPTQKSRNFKSAMQPVDFDSEELKTVGKVVVSPASNENQRIEGTGYKIGSKCIVTAAHVLYPTIEQNMSEANQGKYNGTIKFIRGTGSNVTEQNATVFFQMTKKDDYEVEDNERHFKGYSDIVVLKLDQADKYKKEISIQSPSQLLKDVDGRIGKRITCVGLPSHMTNQQIGSCKGSDFFWKHENARIFAEDKSVNEFGVVTNAAFSPGMSGGGCFLADDNDKKLIGIAVNGYLKETDIKNTMPDIEFVNQQYKTKKARHIATFHVLDQRMKSELGYGLDKLDDICK